MQDGTADYALASLGQWFNISGERHLQIAAAEVSGTGDEGGPCSRKVARLVCQDPKLLAGKARWDLHGTSEEMSGIIRSSKVRVPPVESMPITSSRLSHALQLPLSAHETLILFQDLTSCKYRALAVHRRTPAVPGLAGQCPARAVSFPCRPATGTGAAWPQPKAHRSCPAWNTPLSVTEEEPKGLRHPGSATKQKKGTVNELSRSGGPLGSEAVPEIEELKARRS